MVNGALALHVTSIDEKGLSDAVGAYNDLHGKNEVTCDEVLEFIAKGGSPKDAGGNINAFFKSAY